jgi:hypothetical protein
MTFGDYATRNRAAPTFDPRPDDPAEIIVPILRSGVLAQQFCRSGGAANVEAVFRRSFYLRSGAQFICVGEPSIGNGPLTLIGPIGFLSGLTLEPDRSAALSDREITIGNTVRFTFAQCEPWCPSPWPICQQPGRLIDTCAALSCRAAISAPEEGIARLVFCVQQTHLPALARIAHTHIATFECWLSGVLGLAPPVDLGQSMRGLIGLGVGLTPSGDDFLVGALALLAALGEGQAHAALARTIIDVAPGLTSALSACFLRAAAAGHIGENLQRAVSSVITGDVEATIVAVEKIGHSSGWDMLAGIATTLRIVAAARPGQTRS